MFAVDDADTALAVNDTLPGDGFKVGVVFVFEGAEGIADGTGGVWSTKHGSDSAVAGDFSIWDAADDGVDLLIKVWFGHGEYINLDHVSRQETAKQRYKYLTEQHFYQRNTFNINHQIIGY